MKFIINDDNPEKEQILTLSLTRSGDYIYLKGIQINGQVWNLLWFSADGKVHRCTGIEESSGLEVDSSGRLIIR